MKWTPKTKSNDEPAIPTFMEFHEARKKHEDLEDYPDKVKDFLATAFSVHITKEIFTSLRKKCESGEMTLEQLMNEVNTVMECPDDADKSSALAKLALKYSMTASVLEIATNGIPDDISELMNDK